MNLILTLSTEKESLEIISLRNIWMHQICPKIKLKNGSKPTKKWWSLENGQMPLYQSQNLT